MALEVTLAVAFGREVRIQEGESDELYQQARKVVEAVTRPPGTLGQLGVLIALGGETLCICNLKNYLFLCSDRRYVFNLDLLFRMHAVNDIDGYRYNTLFQKKCT